MNASIDLNFEDGGQDNCQKYTEYIIFDLLCKSLFQNFRPSFEITEDPDQLASDEVAS